MYVDSARVINSVAMLQTHFTRSPLNCIFIVNFVHTKQKHELRVKDNSVRSHSVCCTMRLTMELPSAGLKKQHARSRNLTK